MNTAFSIAGYTVLFLLGVVVGTGQFIVKLHSYDNPSGTEYNGTCCDSDVLKCQLDKCDLKFDICVGKNRGEFDCTYGTKQVVAQPDSNSIDFSESQILRFPITNTLRNPLFIKVNVTDRDTGRTSVLVDTFHFVYNSAAYYNSTMIEYLDYLFTGDRPQHRSKLNLSVTSYCDQNYYGPDCDINCVAEDFGCKGHYKCGVRGEKICNPGWTGKDCDEQIPGGEGDCGFYKDSIELLPSLWEGFYTCPGGSSQKIQMNVTQRNKDDILTSTVLTFDGISFTASGRYGYRTLIIHGKPNQKNITDVKLHGLQPPSNLSSMVGDMKFNRERICTVVLNLQKSYFNQCGSGTCVRYGQKKNEFYCCCGDNANSFCEPTTATGQSTTIHQTPRNRLPTTTTKTTLTTTRLASPEKTATTTTRPTLPETTTTTTTTQATPPETTAITTIKPTSPDTTTITTTKPTSPDTTTITTGHPTSPETITTTTQPTLSDPKTTRTQSMTTKASTTIQPKAPGTTTKTATTDQPITASTNTEGTTRTTGQSSTITRMAPNSGPTINLKPILSKLEECDFYGRLYAILLFNTKNK